MLVSSAKAAIRPMTAGVVLVMAGLMLAHPAQAQQVCPGVPVPGVSGPITNGSDCSLIATGSTINALYVGGSASDEDVLTLPGSGNGVIFDNLTTPAGTTKTLTGVSAGETLDFTLTNEDAHLSFVAGVAYTNTVPPFNPVYHFAYFEFANVSAYDAIFGGSGPPLTSGEATYITNHGGFSDWTFVSVEDLTTQSGDDWNDLVYAFKDLRMAAVPEPGSLGVLACAMLGLTLLRRRPGLR